MKNKFINILFSLTFFSSLIGVWEYSTFSNQALHFILPPPSSITYTLWEYAPRFQFHAWVTFKEMMGGLLLALCVAFPLAWIMSMASVMRSMLQPVFVIVQCIPMFVMAPLMVLWFGWSYTAIIIPTALMIFFPLTISIYQGLCATPHQLMEYFRQHSAKAWQTLFKLQLPYAMPYLFSGFRIAVSLAGIGAIAGEWAGAQQGLGILMLESRRAADIEMMFGAMAYVIFVSLSLYCFVAILEKVISYRYYRLRGVESIVSLVFLAFCASGCSQASDKKETNLRETTMVLDWLPNPNHVALYAGLEKGFFSDEKIDLKIVKVADPSDTIPHLISKQVDICLTYMPHTVQAISRGANVRPIGILVSEPLNALIFRKNEKILIPEDLNDCIVGYCVDGFHTEFVKAMFQHQNIEPADWKNVSFDLVSTLATKQVDVIYGAYWNIEIEYLRAGGVETDYFTLREFGVPSYYELIFLALEGSEESSDEFVEAFKKALQRSINFAVAYPEVAFKAYIAANPDKSQKTINWEYAAWNKTIPALARQQNIDPRVWGDFVEWVKAKGLLK